MITEQERLLLHNRLGDTLGSEEARIMMELLPPSSWDEIATNARVDQLGVDLRAETATQGANLRTEMAGVRTEMAGLRVQMAELESRVDRRLGSFDARMASFEGTVDKRMSGVENKLALEVARLELAIQRSMRQVAAANMAFALTLGAIIVAALKL